MDRLDPSRELHGQYYQNNPLTSSSDSCFIHSLHDAQCSNQQSEDCKKAGELLGLLDYTASIPPYVGLPNCLPHQAYEYHLQDSMDLNILSAENYHEGVYRQPNSETQGRGNTVLYGGLLASSTPRASSPSPPTNMKPRRSAKKSLSKSESMEENSARQRGRPRLDTRDQTAAERRRTQIRLAQRAYRQRKETTITGLNNRVTFLENTIEDVRKTFLAFHERAIASGIENGNPSLANYLQSTGDRISDLAKNSTQDTDAEEEDLDEALAAHSLDTDKRQNNRRRVKTVSEIDRGPVLGYRTTFNGEAGDDDGEIARSALPNPAQTEMMLPLSDWTATEVIQQHQIDGSATTNPSSGIAGHQHQSDTSAPYHSISRSLNMYNAPQYCLDIPEIATKPDLVSHGFEESSNELAPDIHTLPGGSLYDLATLPSPDSYAFQELSFARRLLRISHEKAYRLMSNPNSRPEDLKRMCSFTWCFTSSSDMKDNMKSMTERTARETLELWDVPARHAGGAGLHYPRVGIDASCEPPEWWATDTPTGPRRPGRPETPVPNSMTVAQIVEQVGFDGEWFDPNDVEQYLQSKGLYLDGQSSIVELNEEEAVPALHEGQGLSSSSSNTSPYDNTGGPQSPNDLDMNWAGGDLLQGNEFLWNNDMLENLDVNMDDSCGNIDRGSPKALSPQFDFNALPFIPNLGKQMKRFVDIDKFLKIIVNSAVCLGRAPGFRKSAVDSALTLATTQYF